MGSQSRVVEAIRPARAATETTVGTAVDVDRQGRGDALGRGQREAALLQFARALAAQLGEQLGDAGDRLERALGREPVGEPALGVRHRRERGRRRRR